LSPGRRIAKWFCSLGLIAVVCLANADPKIGAKWEGFHLSGIDGQLRAWEPGRVTVFTFCAYWCDTWRVQVPRLVSARNATRGLPVDFLTISVDGRWAEVAKNNQGLPLWLDRGGTWSRNQGVDRVPTTVVVDASGKVQYVFGAVNRSEDITREVHGALIAKPAGGAIYLTFDDFPPKDGSVELLDALRSLGVKATLFCVGSRVESESSLLRRALNEGHSLQIHSWNHQSSDPQLDRCREVFHRVLRTDPKLYRPPGSEAIIGEQRHHRVVDPYDFTRPTHQELLRRILSDVNEESVIQLHAGVGVTLECLPELVGDLRKRGFEFKILDGSPEIRK